MVDMICNGLRNAGPETWRKILSVDPIARDEAVIAGGGQQTSQAQIEIAWLNKSEASICDWHFELEKIVDKIVEPDWLTLSGLYQQMRLAVLPATDASIPDLRGVLLAPSESAAVVRYHEIIQLVRAVISESEQRQQALNPESESTVFRRHAQFRQAQRRKLEKLEESIEADRLLKANAWKYTVVSAGAYLKPYNEIRLVVISVLDGIPENPFAKSLATALRGIRALTFPCIEYKNDPVGYVSTVLGEDPWHVEGEDSQLTMLLSVRDNRITIVPAGRGLGKTTAVAWLANWWRDTRERGRVFITNFTGNQLRAQDWAEILRCVYRSGICWDCRQAGVKERPCPHSQCISTEDLSEIPTKGIWSEDKERFILGVTANDAQAIGGYHGEEILVICDEFSGTKQEMFDIWDRSITGPDSRFLGPGNCLDGPGSPMHDMVTDERVKKLYNANIVQLDGEVAARAGKSYLPTAKQNGILAEKDPRGRESPEYLISVRGQYSPFDADVIFAPGEIIKASDPALYKDRKPEGRLVLGIDPTGETTARHDLGVIAVMRGLVVIEWRCSYKWTFDDYLHEILDAWKMLRETEYEWPIVGVDADGVGQRLMVRLQNYLESTRIAEHLKCKFQLYPVYFGHQAVNWREYELTGDEGRELVARWLRAGGVFPHNVRLIRAMQHSRWHRVRKMREGQMLDALRSATRKENTPDAYRRVLGYSPDELDALTIGLMAAEKAELGIVPETRSADELSDEEMQPVVIPDDKNALRNYLRAIKSGRRV
jgi:hypothetical protein